MPPEDPQIPPRRRLLAYVTAHPGSHLRELERGTRMAVGVLRHHLDYLVAARLVTETRDGRLRRVFPTGLDVATRQTLAALRPRSHRAVVLYLLNHAPASAAAVGAALSFPASTAAHYLRALVAAGVVARDADGHRLVDPEGVVRALVAYKPSFADRLVDAALEMWFETD